MNKLFLILFFLLLNLCVFPDLSLCHSSNNLYPQVDNKDTLQIQKAIPDSIQNNQAEKQSDTIFFIDDFLESPLFKIIFFIALPIFTFIVALLNWKPLWLWIKRKRDLNYSRYLKNVQSRLRRDDQYEIFPEIKLIREPQEDVVNGRTITDIISSTDKVHIYGKPGSGKTSLVKKIIIELCKEREKGKPDIIPIYLEYRGKDLFNQIRSIFNSNELFKHAELFDINWIKTQLIKKQFLICIDDVHNLLVDTNRKEKSEIEDLLDYKNRIILISRNHINSIPFSDFEHYELQNLSNEWELIEQILKIYSDEVKAQRISAHLKHGMDEKLIRLYNTPQHLKFLAKVFDSNTELDDNKSQLFKRFLRVRIDEDDRKSTDTLSRDFKKEMLASIAYNLFLEHEESAYIVSISEFREVLTQSFQEIKKRLGYSTYSEDLTMKSMLLDGYLIKNGENSVRFEHPQWQEFFAAHKIYYQEKSIVPFVSQNYGKEIAVFVAGLGLPKEKLEKRDFWKSFWKALALADFFLTSQCVGTLIGTTPDALEKIFENFTYNDNDLRTSYEELALLYEEIIETHFPELSKEFMPKGSKRVGVLVERNRENKIWYNYRAIRNDEEKRVLIFDHKEVMASTDLPDSMEYYLQQYGVPFLRNKGGGSAVHDSPALIAFNDIRHQVSEFVRKGNLIETEVMKNEALFIEAVSLSEKLKGHFSGIYNISEYSVLPVGKLLSGIKKFKKDKFVNKFKVPGSRHGSLGREVDIIDFEQWLKKYIQQLNLKGENVIVTPNADLIQVIKNYRLIKDELIPKHREFLIERSTRFYKDVYENYKEVVETNFPTAKHFFRSYAFPIQIFLIREERDNKKYFGKRLVYYNVKKMDNRKDIDVKIVNENEISEIKSEYKGHKGFNYYWGLNSFSIVEPLRNAVYRLIIDEYKELTRRR